MNHLTNLYKYKCEQLQEQISILTRMLNEVEAPGPVQFPLEWNPPLLAPADFQVPLETPTQNPNSNPKPKPTSNPGGFPPQPTGTDTGEWFRWLDDMWYFWLRFFVKGISSNPAALQHWWQQWQQIQDTAPNGIGDMWNHEHPSKGYYIPNRRIPWIPNHWPNHGINDTTIPFPVDLNPYRPMPGDVGNGQGHPI